MSWKDWLLAHGVTVTRTLFGRYEAVCAEPLTICEGDTEADVVAGIAMMMRVECPLLEKAK